MQHTSLEFYIILGECPFSERRVELRSVMIVLILI